MKNSRFQSRNEIFDREWFFQSDPSLAAEKQGLGLKFSIENENFKPRMKISSENDFFARVGMVFSSDRARMNFFDLWALWEPMVWVWVAFHENDGNHENDDNDEDIPDSYKQGVECRIRGNDGNHENDENHENPGCKPRVPQTTGLEIPEPSLTAKQLRSMGRSRRRPNVHFLGHSFCKFKRERSENVLGEV